MAKKYPTPDLSNATPSGLVDMMAKERAKMAEAKFYEGFYKEALKARWPKDEEGKKLLEIKGEDFCASERFSIQERFDVKACRAAAEAGDEIAQAAIKRFYMETPMVQVILEEVVKPAPAVATEQKTGSRKRA